MLRDCKIQTYAIVKMPKGVLDSKNKKTLTEKYAENYGGYFMLCGDLSLMFNHEDDLISPQRFKAHKK
jgi:hypothetical protein